MKQEVWLLVILSIIIAVLIGALALIPAPIKRSSLKTPVEGISIIYPTDNEKLSSPITIKGATNNGGWGGFEGQVGTVRLVDYKNNTIASGVLTATTDWTKTPVSFLTTLTFKNVTVGPMTLLFKNENPSGDQAKDKTFSLPVIIK